LECGLGPAKTMRVVGWASGSAVTRIGGAFERRSEVPWVESAGGCGAVDISGWGGIRVLSGGKDFPKKAQLFARCE
jgi:hypothetical protein